MKPASGRDGSPNYLLICLIGISLGLHLYGVREASDWYRSREMAYIELTMRETSQPFTRAIPRPRPRNEAPVVQDVQKVTVRERQVPQFRIEPMTSRPETAASGNFGAISVPDLPSLPGVSGFAAGDFVPAPAGTPEFFTKQDYMEMLRLRIESKKKYPQSARTRQIEGRVKIRFTVLPDGRVQASEVLETSGHQTLDRAALDAVTAAAPFPKSPPALFKGPLQLEITLIFELT